MKKKNLILLLKFPFYLLWALKGGEGAKIRRDYFLCLVFQFLVSAPVADFLLFAVSVSGKSFQEVLSKPVLSLGMQNIAL